MDEIPQRIGSIVGGTAFLWVIAGGFAFAFHHWGRALQPRSRMIYSALSAAMLIMLLPLITILTQEGLGGESLIMVVALLVGGLFLAALCLPATWWVTRRFERKDHPPSRPFE